MSMFEVSSLKEVLEPEILRKSWEPERSLYQWFTEQEDEDQEDSRQDQENPGSSLQADSIFYVIDLCNI